MKISKEKRDKILEQILAFLYQISPKVAFTSEIAKEVARDEEFAKNLLLELKDKGLIIGIKKNKKGVSYKRRIRWGISDEAYIAYKQKQ